MSSEAADIMTEVHVTSVPDICLVCPSGDSSLKIFASIAVLRNASPVFHSMLGSHFLEGQASANNPGPSLYELHLPEDNAQAMLLLLQIIHLQFREISQAVALPEFPFERIRDTAILADKYDLCQAMDSTFHLFIGLTRIEIMVDSKKLWSILSASYIIGNREAFMASSVSLLECCDTAYYTIIGTGAPRDSDFWISLMLEEKRGKLRAMVSTALLQGMEELTTHVTKNTFTSIEDWANNDMPQVSYKDSLGKTRSMLQDHMADCELEYDGIKLCEVIFNDLDRDILSGICFDCVGNRGKHEEHR